MAKTCSQGIKYSRSGKLESQVALNTSGMPVNKFIVRKKRSGNIRRVKVCLEVSALLAREETEIPIPKLRSVQRNKVRASVGTRLTGTVVENTIEFQPFPGAIMLFVISM
jgi:hypothetical protein